MKKQSPCEKCPLYRFKEDGFQPPVKDDKAQCLIIHQTPASVDGDYELPSESWSSTYAVKCWHGTEEDVPVKAIALCREAYLEKELEEFQGEKILLLGSTAVHSILHGKRKMRKLIGHPFWINSVVGKIPKLAMAVWALGSYLETKNTQILTDTKRAIAWAFNRGIV